jgi:hypothetical protein
VPEPEHFGDVLEAGEAGVHPVVLAAGRGDFDLGHGLPERRRPGVEVLDPCRLEEVGAQVAGHHVRFGDAVRDRGRGGHRRDSVAVAVAERFELHVQIAGALGAVDRGVADVGDGLEVLVVVGLVDLCGYPHRSTYAEAATMPMIDIVAAGDPDDGGPRPARMSA